MASGPQPGATIEEIPWQEVELPPGDLPYDDAEPMESPWHFGNAVLLFASYASARGKQATDFFVGANMVLYFSEDQILSQDYKGPDVFIVKGVDGRKERKSWIVWKEGGHYPDVIFELLSESTRKNDLGSKKHLYEQVFRTSEYFCIAPDVGQLMGWRLVRKPYVPITPDERGWL